MFTIKLPYKTNDDLLPIIKQYSSVLRFVYNRFLDNKSEKEIRHILKESFKFNVDLNSWIVQCAIKDAKGIQKRFKDEKVVFGSKHNFIQRAKNKISKEDFDKKRLSPITIQGERLQQGNRLFKLDIIENNQIIFKFDRKNHFLFKLPKLRKNLKKKLFKLQELNEVKNGEMGYTYTVKFDLDNVYISFEEFKKESKETNSDRYIGIDLNPKSIGISVFENGEIIHCQEFSMEKLIDGFTNEKLSSDNPKSKYYHNKIKFETFEISKAITKIATHYNCKYVFIEELSFKKSHVANSVNRLNKNLWKRNLFISNLNKRLNIFNIDLVKVNPAYSSIIGNLQNTFTDAINASIEIARRGYEFKKQNKQSFYPKMIVKHQWKKMATKYDSYNQLKDDSSWNQLKHDWRKLCNEIKNSKLKYRVSLDDCLKSYNVFKQKSLKSKIYNYVFIT